MATRFPGGASRPSRKADGRRIATASVNAGDAHAVYELVYRHKTPSTPSRFASCVVGSHSTSPSPSAPAARLRRSSPPGPSPRARSVCPPAPSPPAPNTKRALVHRPSLARVPALHRRQHRKHRLLLVETRRLQETQRGRASRASRAKKVAFAFAFATSGTTSGRGEPVGARRRVRPSPSPSRVPRRAPKHARVRLRRRTRGVGVARPRSHASSFPSVSRKRRSVSTARLPASRMRTSSASDSVTALGRDRRRAASRARSARSARHVRASTFSYAYVVCADAARTAETSVAETPSSDPPRDSDDAFGASASRVFAAFSFSRDRSVERSASSARTRASASRARRSASSSASA